MRSGPYLEIALDQPELLFRGSFDEAGPALLSGRLIVHLHETIRVRSLKLTFTGRLDTFLSQNLVSSVQATDEHREIITHTWQFLEPQKHPVQWGPRTQTFPFDLLVPGDNPETIQTALGKVRYQLQATLERTSFHGNLSALVDVAVKRGPVSGAPWALALMESIEAVGSWERQLDYRISVPTRSLKDGELFHTRFELEPRVKGLKLVAVGVLIKEYARYYSAQAQPLHRFARVVARNENYIAPSGACSIHQRRADDCMDLAGSTTIHIPLAVPQAYGHIQYDVLTELIEVRHRIKFLVKVRDANMIIHSVFIAVPVAIMPVTARDDSSILPRYETAVRNPGSLIMRSDTLPPAYDTVRADDPGPEPGEDIDGFPAALHRSRSQFYLASPDHSPVLRAADSDAQPAPNHNNSRPTFEISPPTFNISPQTLNSSPQTLSISQQTLNNTPSDEAQASAQSAASCNADSVSTLASPAAPPPEQPPEKSARASEHCLAVASHPASLHERLANSRITDKVRSIFHARSSSSHSRHHRRNRSSCSSAGLQPPPEIRRRPSSVTRSMTPPPARIHEPIGVHEPIGAHVSAPRRSSAAPSSGYSLHSPSQPVEGEARFAGGLDHQRNMHAPRPPPTAMLQSPGSPHRNPTPIASPLITH